MFLLQTFAKDASQASMNRKMICPTCDEVTVLLLRDQLTHLLWLSPQTKGNFQLNVYKTRGRSFIRKNQRTLNVYTDLPQYILNYSSICLVEYRQISNSISPMANYYCALLLTTLSGMVSLDLSRGR